MADVGIEQLKEDIQSNINTNNNQEITGAVLQGQLLDTVDTLKGYTDDYVSVSQNTLSIGGEDVAAVPDTWVENPEWLDVKTDNEGNILEGIRKDGTKYIAKRLYLGSDIMSADGKGLSQNNFSDEEKEVVDSQRIMQDAEDRVNVLTDLDNKILSYRDKSGRLHEPAGIETDSLHLTPDGMTEFQQALKDSGFNPGGTGDWSDYLSKDGKNPLSIPQPKGLAMVNIISNANLMSLSKSTTPGAIEGVTYDIHAFVEFWDMQGNYFRKPVLMSGQGTSSMQFDKKNIALDFFDSEIDGDAFAVRFGNWVPQDSWHLKAYYTDAFRCIGLATYKLYDRIVKTRGIKDDYIYKRALIDFSKIGYVANGYNDLSNMSLQFETGAKCFPDGFPVAVYQNGEFWGLYCWQIKKHRDNYHMSKSSAKQIHLDGTINRTTLFDGVIDWDASTGFEIRNPKDLYLMDGTKYDADTNSGELMDSTSAYYDSTNPKHVMTAEVKQYIIDFSHVMSVLNTAEETYEASSKTASDMAILKAVFETYFDVENLIDYLILSDITRNYDGFSKNWQWLTYDGVKWYCGLYDCDGCFGGNFTGTSNIVPLSGRHISTTLMNHFIVTYYESELISRYAELRAAKVIDKNEIISIINGLVMRFGEKNIEKEFTKWSNSPCNRDTIVNENWEFDLDNEGNPQLGTADYDSAVTYNVGDTCFYAQYPNNGEAAYKYKAKATVTGTAPVDQFGYRDSIYRVFDWIAQSIENMDSVYSYSE